MLEIVSADRNDYNEVIARIATCCERAGQALMDVNMWAERMGIKFLTALQNRGADRIPGKIGQTDIN